MIPFRLCVFDKDTTEVILCPSCVVGQEAHEDDLIHSW